MSGHAFRRWIKSSMASLGEAIQSDKDLLPQWASIREDIRRMDYLVAIKAEDWEQLMSLARSELRARTEDWRGMRQRQKRLAALMCDMHRMKVAETALLDFSCCDATDPERISTIEAALVDKGITGDRLQAVLDHLQARAKGTLHKGYKDTTLRLVSQLDEIVLRHMASSMGAVIALGIAQFNLEPLPLSSGENTETFVYTGEDLRQATLAITRIEREIFQSLRSGNRFSAWGWAESLVSTAARSFFGPVLMVAANVPSVKTGQIRDADQGSLALSCGDAARSMLRAIALGRRIAWLCLWPEEHPEMAAWMRAAERLTFPSKAKWPSRLMVSSLLTRPDHFDGRQVTVEGQLVSLTIVQRARKSVSTAILSDQNGREIPVILPYIRLDSGGITPGAWVRFSGKWQAQSDEISVPALHLGRLPYTQLARVSWSDWATHRLRPIYTPVTQGLTASWSWEQGIEGPGNQLIHQTWYSGSRR